MINSLIPNWKPTNTIYDIINKLPKFLNIFDQETQNKLLSTYGIYYINSFIYNINDFLCNSIIQCFHIEICIQTNNGLIFEPRFLVVTDNYIIILHSIDEKNQSLCVISFYSEIQNIEKISKTIIDDIELNEKSCMKFIWEPGAINTLYNVIAVSQLKINNLIDCIMEKRNSLKYRFDLFYSNSINNVVQLEKIISIKEKILEKEKDEIIFQSIIELYQKIIEIYTVQNDDGYQKYMDKLHQLIKKYNNLIIK